MKSPRHMKRRSFLKTGSGALGLLALGGFWAGNRSVAQEINRSRSRQQAEKVLRQLEPNGRQFLSVPRPDGQFLNLMVKSAQARNVLEVGTSHGYSAIWIGLGLEETGGHLTTIDIRPDRVQLAKQNLTEAGLEERVACLEGDAHLIVPTLHESFDFVFLDADKDGQLDYFHHLYPDKINAGAILAVHNAIRSRNAMKDYLDMIGRHPDFDSIVLSVTMDDGFSVSYRKRNPSAG